jgi:predicted DNA-binding transcriptional regulator AlpA
MYDVNNITTLKTSTNEPLMSNGRKARESRRSLTINQFLRKHRISRSTYYDLKKRGLGPTEMRISDRIVRISPRADREWVEKMEALKSPAPGDQGREDGKTVLRQKGRFKGSTPSSPPKRHGDKSDEIDTLPQRHEKGHGNDKSLLTSQKERSKECTTGSRSKRSKRPGIERVPQQQKTRSKERSSVTASRSQHRGERSGESDKARPQGKAQSKKRRQRRSRKPRSRKGIKKPQLDLKEVKRRLRAGERLPKDDFIESNRWRLDTNPHRHRDRGIERALLQVLTARNSSEAEHQQALEQASCTPDARCRRLMCWLCKHLTWLKLRQKLTDMLGHRVPPDDISWVTVVNQVLEPSPRALHRPMSEFRYWPMSSSAPRRR